jgi:spore maturation protein CgeB
VLCVFGRHNYGVADRGASYEYANIFPAIERLGHEAILFDSWNKEGYADYGALNKELVATIKRIEPEVIFFVLMGYEIWIETLEWIRSVGKAVTVNWAPDDSWKYVQSSRYLIPFFDVHCTTFPPVLAKARRDGYGNVFLTQWAANAAALTPPKPARECSIDVSFVGTAYGARHQWISALTGNGILVEAFGHGWPNGAQTTEQLAQIILNSKISLNFADPSTRWSPFGNQDVRQIKARTFEVPGAGGLLMTQNAEGLGGVYRIEREIVVFDDIEELVDKIRRLLDKPEERDAIANAGFKRTKTSHTYDHRLATLFQYIDTIRQAKTAAQNDRFVGLDHLIKIHRNVSIWRPFRWCMVMLASLFLGRQRGARAMRKLVYEMSWRCAGERTYRAVGLAGRLFYRES